MRGATAGGQSDQYFIKLIIIGDTSVGKTSLLLWFAENTFSPQHIATIGKYTNFACSWIWPNCMFIFTVGIDFKVKHMQIDGKNVKLQIWDTAGQERFRTITQSYYKGAHGILLAFDTTNITTFNNMQAWLG